MRRIGSCSTSIAIGCGLAILPAAVAQWEVRNLHPAGASSSIINAVADGQQVGTVMIDGIPHASLWTGRAATWVDLHRPIEAPQGSWGYGVAAGVQVGAARVGTTFTRIRACLWNGSADTWVDLHREGDSDSIAYAAFNGVQVGQSGEGSFPHSVRWSGSAESITFVPSPLRGFAYGIWGESIVGTGWFVGDTIRHAYVSSGSTWVDLDGRDRGFTDYGSSARGVYEDRQVGAYAIAHGQSRAALWSGTSESRIDLTPSGAVTSAASAIWGEFQAGSADDRAGIWSGTAESWFSLHQFLAPEFTTSHAFGIWSDGVRVYVAGNGHNSITGRSEALLWTGGPPVPCPADLDGSGQVDLADLAILLSHFGTLEGADPTDGDLDVDGDIDLEDLAALLASFGSLCP